MRDDPNALAAADVALNAAECCSFGLMLLLLLFIGATAGG
jgi:hypothetical protein